MASRRGSDRRVNGGSVRRTRRKRAASPSSARMTSNSSSARVPRLRAALIAVVYLVMFVPMQPSGAASTQQRTLQFSYTGQGPAELVVEGRLETDDRLGLFAMALTTERGDRVNASQPTVIAFGDANMPPRVYGAAGQHDVCAAPAMTCAFAAGSDSLAFRVAFTINPSSESSTHRLFMALEGRRIEVQHKAPRWQARLRTGGFAHTGDAAMGIRVSSTSAEAAPIAALPGGKEGSVAIAVPPCTDVGIGALALRGGPQEKRMLCPSERLLTDVARTATQWTFGGQAAGVTTHATRLIVLDMQP